MIVALPLLGVVALSTKDHHPVPRGHGYTLLQYEPILDCYLLHVGYPSKPEIWMQTLEPLVELRWRQLRS